MENQVLDRYKQELERIRHSKSWRITKPFRLASSVSKKILRITPKLDYSTKVLSGNTQSVSKKAPRPLSPNETSDFMRMSSVAEIAMNSKNWAEAVACWERTLDKYRTNTPSGVYVRASICYRKLDMKSKSRSLVSEGVRMYPKYIPLRIEAAEIAMDEKNWQKAITLWKSIINKFGDKTPVDVWVKLARAYRYAGNYSSCDNISKKGLSKFPDHKRLIEEFARSAVAQNNISEVVKRWEPTISSLNKKSSVDDWVNALDARYYTSIAKRILNIDQYKKMINRYVANIDKKKADGSQNKIVIYTAISGSYDSIKLPEKLLAEVDYVLFTDKPTPDSGVYKIRPFPFFFDDPARSSRYVKTHPHILLPEYDIAIWVDASVLISGNIQPMIKQFISSKKTLASIPHPSRNTIYEEAEACVKFKKDDKNILDAQIDHYHQLNFKSNVLIESGIMMYNLRDSRINDFLNLWWKEIESYSKRDQISLSFALEQTKATWLPLAKKPNSIRNHPLFILAPHTKADKLIDKLTALTSRGIVDPSKDSFFTKLRQERIDAQNNRTIDIIVCVHNAYEAVKKCLESIERSKTSENLSLIIVDDGSGKQTSDYLVNFSKGKSWVKILRNSVAQGYTKAANKGLRASTAELMILLNSDTVVSSGWAEKLADVAFSEKDIAIVGPLSSAASHQSIPEHKSSKTQTAINGLPKGLSVEDVNRFCESVSYGNIFPRVPLVHGFCFAIKREALDKLGLFDDKNFPRGYGEENDFCFRATNAGFGMKIATNTYVFHEKSKSYTDTKRQELMKNGSAKLVELYSKDRITRSILTMQSNPLLERMRKKANKLYETK